MANSEMDYIHGYMADQTYDPTSMNAQSGIAVNQALNTILIDVGRIDTTYGAKTINFTSNISVRYMLVVTSNTTSNIGMWIGASSDSANHIIPVFTPTGSTLTVNSSTAGKIVVSNSTSTVTNAYLIVFSNPQYISIS